MNPPITADELITAAIELIRDRSTSPDLPEGWGGRRIVEWVADELAGAAAGGASGRGELAAIVAARRARAV